MAPVLFPLLVDVTAFLLEFFLRRAPHSSTFCCRKENLLPSGVDPTPPHPAGLAGEELLQGPSYLMLLLHRGPFGSLVPALLFHFIMIFILRTTI